MKKLLLLLSLLTVPAFGQGYSSGGASLSGNNTWTAAQTFSAQVISSAAAPQFKCSGTGTCEVDSSITDTGGTDIGFTFKSLNALTGGTDKLFSVIRSDSTEMLYFIDGTQATSFLYSAGGLWAAGSINFGSTFTLQGGFVLSEPANTNIFYESYVANAATARGHRFGTNASYTTAGAKLASFENATVEKVAIDKSGKFVWPTGAADAVAGRSALTAGTVTVSTTAVTASSVIQLTRCVGGGTAGLPQVGTVTAGTSFVINSIQPGTASTLQAADTSTVCWQLGN